VRFPVHAITLDLDDTLWPFAPIGARIERALHAWMEAHSPRTAARFPIAEMRALRECVVAEHPQHAHDLSLLRRLTIERALRDSGGDVALAEAAYAIFFAERNRVDFYPDARAALARLAARVPLAALSNGNADLAAIGVAHHFRFQLGAREHGAAKPDAGIFHAACARLGVEPRNVLHVGDHPEMDVAGAHRAGLRSCWLNRADATWRSAEWTRDDLQPDLTFDSLALLADWLEAQPAHRHIAA
jgi:putative hydrolase of the HAD superfamily